MRKSTAFRTFSAALLLVLIGAFSGPTPGSVVTDPGEPPSEGGGGGPTVWPNDPYYATTGTWGQAYQDQWGLYAMNIPAAWNKTAGDYRIIIAVLDTGVDYRHADLQRNLWFNPHIGPNGTEDRNGNNCADWYPYTVQQTDCRGQANQWGDLDFGFDTDGNGFGDDVGGLDTLRQAANPNGATIYSDNDGDGPADDEGHGTAVAGIAAAVTNNAAGIAGVCPNCTIMPIRVANQQGLTDDNHIAAGIEYAINNGARIINISLEAGTSLRILADLDAAASRGIVIVKTAGKSSGGVLIDSSMLESRPNLVAVGGIQNNRTTIASSNWGPELDVVAPGQDILSLLARDQVNRNVIGNPGSNVVGNDYRHGLTGTSFAAPFISGVVGLMLSVNPDLTVDEVIQLLHDSGDRPGIPDDHYGYGLVNADTAVGLAKNYKASLRWETGSIWAQPMSSGSIRLHVVASNTGMKNAQNVHYRVYDNSNPAAPVPLYDGTFPFTLNNDHLPNFDDQTISVPSYPSSLKLVLDPDNAIPELDESAARHQFIITLPPLGRPVWDGIPRQFVPKNEHINVPLNATTAGTTEPVEYSCVSCPGTSGVAGSTFSWTPTSGDVGLRTATLRARNTVRGSTSDTTAEIEVLDVVGGMGHITLMDDQSFASSVRDGKMVTNSAAPDVCSTDSSRCALGAAYHLLSRAIGLRDIHYLRVQFNPHGAWNASLPAPYAQVDDNTRAHMGTGYWPYVFDLYPSVGADNSFPGHYGVFYSTLRFVEQDDQAHNWGTPGYVGWPRSWRDWNVECIERANGDEDKNGLGVRFWSTGTDIGSGSSDVLSDMSFCLIDDSPGDISPEWSVSAKLKNLNTAPSVDAIAARTVAEGSVLSFSVTGTDPNDDTLTWSATGMPAGATLSSTGRFSWTPNSTQAGDYDVAFTAADGLANSAAVTGRITVTDVPAPPVLAPIGTRYAYIGTVFTLQVSATDPDGGPLSFSATGLPSGATLSSTTGQVSWLLVGTGVYPSSYTVTFRVTDNTGRQDSEVVVIYVRTLSCFLAGTLVSMDDGTLEPIERIRPGDLVRSYDERTGLFVPAAVQQTFVSSQAMHLVLNGRIQVTEKHPFLVGGRWVEAGDLAVGDVLVTGSGGDEILRSIEKVEREDTVYNLEVEGTHTYVADGVVVHNKPPVGGGGRLP